MPRILVRLPNWLGDMVMSAGFLHQLPHFFPGSEVSVIVKKGLEDLLSFFPGINRQFVFSREEHPGFFGPYKFGRSIKSGGPFDLFFCLPNSFSSAFMGFPVAPVRIGYKNEGRQILLTHSWPVPKKVHRAEEYVRLLELYTKKKALPIKVSLFHAIPKNDYVVVNINSEASSRRLTLEKALEIVNELRKKVQERIIMIGAPKEKDFVEEVIRKLDDTRNIESVAGSTSLIELAGILAGASLMLSTDSGPAHLANALGTYTVVLFGAGNEAHTAPYDQQRRSIIRLGKLSCEPCEKNICVRYGIPQCLTRLDTNYITELVKNIR